MEVYYRQSLIGTVSKESVPAIYFVCRENDFQIDLSYDDDKLFIEPGLTGSELHLSIDCQLTNLEGVDKINLEKRMIKEIRDCLLIGGVTVHTEEEGRQKGGLLVDMKLVVASKDVKPHIKIVLSSENQQANWEEFLQVESVKLGFQLSISVEARQQREEHLQFIGYFPPLTAEQWDHTFSRKIVHFFTLFILSRFQQQMGVSTLSLFPLLEPFLIKDSLHHMTEKTQLSKHPIEEPSGTSLLEPKATFPHAEAYFDYHFLVNEATKSPPKMIGHLFIKNTGNVMLINPTVCFRIQPPGSVFVSGQILPSRATKVLGFQSSEGSKGWKYMKDDWLADAEQKGEVWITTVQETNIAPNETLSVPNLQVKVRQSVGNIDIKVEAFVYFQDSNLQIASVNKMNLFMIKDINKE